MTYIETAPGTRKIAWTQDSHGQWSSGDLEVRPIVAEHGPVCWNLFLDDKCIGRSFGYSRPGVAKATAPLLKPIRELLQGRTGDPSYQDLRGEVQRLRGILCDIARGDPFREHPDDEEVAPCDMVMDYAAYRFVAKKALESKGTP